MHPNLRLSVPLLTLDRIAKHLKLEWKNAPEGFTQVAEGSDLNNSTNFKDHQCLEIFY
jgi:hypothetical protein